MAVAFAYPEPEKGGRGKKGKATESGGFSQQRLREARQVLAYSKELARQVFNDTFKLGQDWKERPKNKGAEGTGSNQYEVRCTLGTAPPPLADYGLDGKRAARDVTFSDIEEEPFERRLRKNTFAQHSCLLRLEIDTPGGRRKNATLNRGKKTAARTNGAAMAGNSPRGIYSETFSAIASTATARIRTISGLGSAREPPRLKPDTAASAAAGDPTVVDGENGIRLPEILCRRTLGRFVWKRDRRRGWVVTEI